MALEHAVPEIDGLAGLDLEPDASALSEVLNVAFAQHEICASGVRETLDFFRESSKKRGRVARAGGSPPDHGFHWPSRH